MLVINDCSVVITLDKIDCDWQRWEVQQGEKHGPEFSVLIHGGLGLSRGNDVGLDRALILCVFNCSWCIPLKISCSPSALVLQSRL